MTTYSPNVRITLEHGGASIRLSDVLENSARVYSKDFEPIEAGSICELVIKVDDKETREQVQLVEDLSCETEEFTFMRSKAMSETKLSRSEFKKIKIMTGEEYIKVSELREWCEDRILSLELEENLCHYDFGVIFAYKSILNKFCGSKDE